MKYIYEFPLWNAKNILSIDEIYSGYYMRVQCLDRPGVMGRIASILGDHQININATYATIEEKEKKERLAYVHIFINHALERDVKEAISKIQSLTVVRGKVVFFRIIDEVVHGDSDS
jgi:homoserine dehydrogenase